MPGVAYAPERDDNANGGKEPVRSAFLVVHTGFEAPAFVDAVSRLSFRKKTRDAT